MSDSIANDGSNQSKVTSTQPTMVDVEEYDESDSVSKKAYIEKSRDMHKYKAQLKEERARAAEYEAKLKALEEEKLVEQQRFEELYKRERQQRENVEKQRHAEKELYLRAVKLSALKAEIGNVKDVYLQHANIDSIDINEDGSISSDSVKSVADQFRQEHGQLIPRNAGSNITNPASPTSFDSKSNEKPIAKMSFEEKAAMLKKLKNT